MNQEKIWDYYQSKGKSSFDGSYLRLRFLASKCAKGEKVLNIGVGGAIFEKIALNKSIDVYSLDPSEGAIENIQNWIGGKKAKIGFSDSIPFESNFFDVVVMSEVLEHLSADILERTLAEVYRVIKPRGKFIGTVPNDENLDESTIICPNCSYVFHRWGHVQCFNKHRLEQLLLTTFKTVKVEKRGWLSREKLDIKIWICSILNNFLYKMDMRKYGGNLFFFCLK